MDKINNYYVYLINNITEDNRNITYATNSHNPETVIVRIVNQYFQKVEYHTEITIPPGGYCWTYTHNVSDNRYIEFIDKDTNEIVGLYKLDGLVNYKQLWYSPYIENIIKRLNYQGKLDIEYIMNEIIYYKIYNNDFISVAENDLVIDIGFNYGLFSLDSLQKNPKKIIGFEPNKILVDWYNADIKNDKIELHNLAVSDTDSFTTFFENEYFGKSSIKSDVNSDSTKKSYQVQTIDFGNYIKNNHIEKIDYLKIDCEGAEYEIIDSIDIPYLKNCINKIAIEFHNEISHPKVQNLFEKLDLCGFEVKKEYEDGATTGMIFARNKIFG